MKRYISVLQASVLFSSVIFGSAEISVLNSGFESPKVSSILLGTAGDQWVRHAPFSPPSSTGLVPNDDERYPVSSEGDQYLFICARKSNESGFGTPNMIYQQILGGLGQPSLIAGQYLSLTVSLADMLNSPDRFSFGLYGDENLSREFAVTEGMSITLGTGFHDFTIGWTAGPDDAGCPVYVGFKIENYGTNASTPRLGIDDVRITSDAFMIRNLFVPGGKSCLAVAPDGTLLALHMDSGQVRMSTDGGFSWSVPMTIGVNSDAAPLVDDVSGEVLFISPFAEKLWRSRDSGRTWEEESIQIQVNRFNHGTSSGVPQYAGTGGSGIILSRGGRSGRLLVPTWMAVSGDPSRGEAWWKYQYSCAMYSDDGGLNWQTSDPFPVFGTMGGGIVEYPDGRIYYNSRAHTASDALRRIAWSFDGGGSWINPEKDPGLSDGLRRNDYGCHGGLVFVSYEENGILLYSNVDAEESGESLNRCGNRRNITVWASFDGGQSWPVKRLVYEGPSGYSFLAAGKPGTGIENQIYMVFSGGPEGEDSSVQFVRFDLSWLLQNRL